MCSAQEDFPLFNLREATQQVSENVEKTLGTGLKTDPNRDSGELLGNQAVRLERLIDLGEPFSPGGGAAAATLVQWQFQIT